MTVDVRTSRLFINNQQVLLVESQPSSSETSTLRTLSPIADRGGGDVLVGGPFAAQGDGRVVCGQSSLAPVRERPVPAGAAVAIPTTRCRARRSSGSASPDAVSSRSSTSVTQPGVVRRRAPRQFGETSRPGVGTPPPSSAAPRCARPHPRDPRGAGDGRDELSRMRPGRLRPRRWTVSSSGRWPTRWATRRQR